MADIHQPHDRLFRAVFSDAGEAASLLQAALPNTIRGSFDWTTMTLVEGTFIDDDLRESQSDLLYQVEHMEAGQSVSMYLLFEHQSSPDPWLRLRLLRYCCRIWEADRRDDPERSELRPIVPVVFYQGARGWTHSTEFSDLFPEGVRSLPWVPRFAHELLDQTTLEPEAVAGNVKGRIAQLLMMVAFGRHMEAALDWAARWTLSLRQAEGGVDEFRRFIVYLAAVQDDSVIETFSEALERHGLDLKGEIMTYAEQLLAEGRAEGEAKGEQRTKVQIVEGLLQAGVTWEVIEAATGLTEAGFEALKAQLAGSDAAP
jgi:predicted transposase/invertase (TIGR01784 family)